LTPRHFQFGGFKLFPSDQLLVRGSEPISLAPKLFDLLLFMVEHRGRLLTRDELMRVIWPDTVVEETNLTVNVSLLRKILGDGPDGKPYIDTVPRRGYRFHAEVAEVAAAEDPRPAPPSNSPAGVATAREDSPAPELHPSTSALASIPHTPERPPSALDTRAQPSPPAWPFASPEAQPSPVGAGFQTGRPRPYASRAVLGLLGLIGLSICAAVYYSVPRPSTPIAAVTTGPRNLAVLPFRNLKRVPVDDFLGFALADAIITKLGYVSELSVRPSSAVARFEGMAAVELQKIAGELHVDTLLTGTYVHEGDVLRIRAQLVDSKTQRLLWSDTINLSYENLLGVQDRVAQEIVAGLEVPLSAPEAAHLAESRPAKAAAYEQYLKGVELYATNRFDQSILALENSARMDPDFPLTWAMLGRAYTTEASLHFGGSRDYGKALAAYQKALQLDPTQIEPRVYMANLFTDTGQVNDAVPLLQEALKINPNHAEANWEMSYAYRFGGLLAESVASAERARRLDPSVKLNSSAINAYLYLGRYDDFLARLPTEGASAYILFYRGFAEYHLGRHGDAQRHFDLAYGLDSSLLQTEVGETLSLKLKGDPGGGMTLLHDVEAQLLERGVTDAEAIYKVAQAYAQLGDTPAALRALEKSVDGGFFCYPYLQRDPLLEPVRNSAGFSRVLAKAQVRFEGFKARFAAEADLRIDGAPRLRIDGAARLRGEGLQYGSGSADAVGH
jgi:DNA-binding winged helix-turn-helix (wHTH) protein/TolB-like protein